MAWEPAGLQELFDLTVEGANHYITGAIGLINRNCFDEGPQLTESQFRFIIGWNRTTIVNQRCRVVVAGNPPLTPEGEWVIVYWAPWLDDQHPNPALPGELRWFAVIDGKDVEVENSFPFDRDGELIQPQSRTFIPADLSDNPYLLRTNYRATLANLPEPLRSQLLKGSFTAGHDDDPWQVIPTEWVLAAQERWSKTPKPDESLTAVGIDVARGGQAKTVLAPRYGTWFDRLQKYPGKATPDGPAVAGLVGKVLTAGGYGNIDVIGVGASAFDSCVGQHLDVRAVNFAEATSRRDRTGTLRMANVRAAAYWMMREALDPQTGDNIALPPDHELRADLCSARWTMRLSGVQVEAKEDIVKRLGRSPDCGDAVVLAAYLTGSGMNVTALGNFRPSKEAGDVQLW